MEKKKHIKLKRFIQKVIQRHIKETKKKNIIISYECKKPQHFKSECPNLDRTKDKKTWENLNGTSSDEEETKEEANFCLMVDTTIEDSGSDEEVNLYDLEFLKLVYHELFSNSSILSKAYKNLRKDFKNLSKDHTKLKRLITISIFQLNLMKTIKSMIRKRKRSLNFY